MNEKEKEAIRVLNEDLKLAKEEDSIDIDVLTGNLEIALNLIEKQQAELEKKDKIIDLMASAIGYEPLPIDEYCVFRNFDCPVVGGNRDCKDCIKQYFERKIENGN